MDLVGGIGIAFHRAFEVVTNVGRSLVRLSLSFKVKYLRPHPEELANGSRERAPDDRLRKRLEGWSTQGLVTILRDARKSALLRMRFERHHHALHIEHPSVGIQHRFLHHL